MNSLISRNNITTQGPARQGPGLRARAGKNDSSCGMSSGLKANPYCICESTGPSQTRGKRLNAFIVPTLQMRKLKLRAGKGSVQDPPDGRSQHSGTGEATSLYPPGLLEEEMCKFGSS